MHQANMFILILMFKNADWKFDSKKNSNIDGLIFYKQIIGFSEQILCIFVLENLKYYNDAILKEIRVVANKCDEVLAELEKLISIALLNFPGGIFRFWWCLWKQPALPNRW